MPVRITISHSSRLSSSDVTNKVSEVLTEARRLLDNANQEELCKIEEMVELKVVGVNISNAELILWCCTLSDLERLRDWLINGKMHQSVELLFNRLLKTSRDTRITVNVDGSEENYTRCVEYFQTKRGK